MPDKIILDEGGMLGRIVIDDHSIVAAFNMRVRFNRRVEVLGPDGAVQTTIDKKFISKVYTLTKAKAAEIEPIIAKAISPEGGLTKTMTVDGVQLLVVSAPTYMMAGVDAIVP